jgi:hypothetical protein
MRVYDIRAGRAFWFILISIILSTGTTFGLSLLFREHVGPWKSAMEQLAKAPTADERTLTREKNRQAQNAALKVAEDVAGDRGRSPEERQASLTTMYKQLDAMRVALQPGDRESLAHYEECKARYEKLLKELREDVLARQRQPARAR